MVCVKVVFRRIPFAGNFFFFFLRRDKRICRTDDEFKTRARPRDVLFVPRKGETYNRKRRGGGGNLVIKDAGIEDGVTREAVGIIINSIIILCFVAGENAPRRGGALPD